VLRKQSHGGNAGKLPDEVSQHFYLLRRTAMHRDQHGIHRSLSDDAHGIGNRVPVNHCETATSCGIHSSPLDWEQNRGDGG
jgi:hypothetical protein